MDGILPLWKPKGMTSHDCVFKIRKLLRTKKVGHTGTLDPDAEGVLPVCVGKATKIVQFLTNTRKTYIAEVTIGTATDTEDAGGKIISRKIVSAPPSEKEIVQVLQMFTGDITQIPPMYSAVKVNGKKLYEYARANEAVKRPERKITIYDINLLGKLADDRFAIEVICSKGTYIRTLCVDIGARLGYPAHMSNLIRTESGPFSKADTVTFQEIENAVATDEASKFLQPIHKGLSHLDILEVNNVTKKKVLFGQKLEIPVKKLKTDPFVIMHESQVLAIYQMHPEKKQQIKPVTVFSEV